MTSEGHVTARGGHMTRLGSHDLAGRSHDLLGSRDLAGRSHDPLGSHDLAGRTYDAPGGKKKTLLIVRTYDKCIIHQTRAPLFTAPAARPSVSCSASAPSDAIRMQIDASRTSQQESE